MKREFLGDKYLNTNKKTIYWPKAPQLVYDFLKIIFFKKFFLKKVTCME
ncbi:MAG: hypothetical protein Q8838_02510 [Candidatus Phytoplasma australasiaticum]|nr:hypothetical protein [Candidatus Phytoplasma australasiaticum]